jgi:hypothetical protein
MFPNGDPEIGFKSISLLMTCLRNGLSCALRYTEWLYLKVFFEEVSDKQCKNSIDFE